MSSTSIMITEIFRPYLETVLARLAYLYPGVNIHYDEETYRLHVTSTKEPDSLREMEKEVNYLLYREKIFQDTLPIRKKLYGEAF